MEPFTPDRDLLDRLARVAVQPWSGIVWRHKFAANPPAKTNQRGARWNPPGVEALYTSLDPATAIAAADYLLAVQPLRPRAKRSLHELEVTLASLLDLSDAELLRSLGVDDQALRGDDHRQCQALGGAAAFLRSDGIIVPSARSPGHNLVILFSWPAATPEVHLRRSEVLSEP